VQDLPDDAAVVKDAVRCAAGCGAALTFVHAVPRSFGQRSVDLDKAVAHGLRLLDTAVRQATAQAVRLHAELIPDRSSCGCGRTSSSGRRSTRTCWWSAGPGPSTGGPSAGRRSSPAAWAGRAQRPAPRPVPGAAALADQHGHRPVR
jgi:hypothetical protein